MADNPYRVLDVPRDATDAEIRSAYREAARQHHPDAGGKAADFDRATKAYRLLTDQSRRRRYDETGQDEAGGEPDNKTAEAIGDLITALDGAMASCVAQNLNPFRTDLVAMIRAEIERKRNRILAGRHTLQVARQQMTRMVGRFNRRAKGRNIFEASVRQKLDGLDQEIARTNQDYERYELALAMLDEYTYRADDDDPLSLYMSRTFTGAATITTTTT